MDGPLTNGAKGAKDLFFMLDSFLGRGVQARTDPVTRNRSSFSSGVFLYSSSFLIFFKTIFLRLY